MAKVVFLGNCANQTATHETVSFVVEDRKKLLFETGPGVVRQLYRAGYAASEIDAVFVSHSHGDHTLGFPYFAFSNFYERVLGKVGPQSIPLIASQSVCRGLLSMLSFCYPPGKFPSFEITELIADGNDFTTFKLDDILVTTAPVGHTVPTLGVRIELPSAKIAYSADTVYSKNVVELAKGCDLLIAEAFATSEMKELASRTKHGLAEEAGKVAQDAGAKQLALVHMLPKYIGQEQLLVSEASNYFSGKIFIPAELAELLL